MEKWAYPVINLFIYYMKHVYKITKSNEWKNFSMILFSFIVFAIGAPIMFYYRNPEDSFWDAFPYFAIAFLLFLIPQCIIHMRCYSLNEGMEMIYDDMDKSIVIKDTKKETVSEFHLDDIKHIFHTSTPAFAEKRMHWFPWDSYNYSDIFLKDGRKYRITSLMVYRLELPIGDRYEVITSLYPYPSS